MFYGSTSYHGSLPELLLVVSREGRCQGIVDGEAGIPRRDNSPFQDKVFSDFWLAAYSRGYQETKNDHDRADACR